MCRLKPKLNVVVMFLLLLAGAVDLALAQTVKEIWVSPVGNDANPGTKDQPKATLMMAQRKARELRRLNDPSIKDGIHIIMKGGTYRLDETVLFRPEDSGTDKSPTIVMAATGEEPVLCGGLPVTNWRRVTGNIPGLPPEAYGEVWVAEAPKIAGRIIEFRQMWVNGRKADRASTLSDGPLDRILSVDQENEAFWIPRPGFSIKEIGTLEFVIHQWWAIANLRVKDIQVYGDSAYVTFHQPESRIEFEHPWPPPFIDENKDQGGNSAFFFVSAMELLNGPNQWYMDLTAGKVYYWPREDENMTTAEVIVPYLETILHVFGTPDLMVQHVHFDGIHFKHTTWLRPSQAGHVPLQAGWYIIDAYELRPRGTPDKARLCNQAWIGRQPAGIAVEGASHLRFERCILQHMAATGIDLIKSTNNNIIVGNIIQDIGGTGIQIGFFGGPEFEAHLPYDPADQREICQYEYIANNIITNCTNEDWGTVGISVGFARNINIEHNEVSYLNYTGISLGWGWTSTISCARNNRIHANHIHNFAGMMYDVGGIYTLSAQPNTEISNNSIHTLLKAPYAHIPEHYQYIYFDEGSSYIRAINNWTEEDRFFSNTPGPGNEWVNNGPQVAKEIKESAGLLPEYKYLLNKIDNYEVSK